MKKRIAVIFAALLLVFSLSGKTAYAASGPTDEIINYVITVDVNEDATLYMTYHVEWKVLDDDSLGPLEWVKVGIPNSHTETISALSSNISRISLMHEHGEYYARVDLDRPYYEGETVSFDFSIIQGYMYEMNVLTEGESVFYFVPGWFDGIEVDHIEIRWNADKVKSNSHGATPEDGYLVWSGSLDPGEKFEEISITYNTADYAFDESKSVSKDYGSNNYSDYGNDSGYGNYSNYSSSDGEEPAIFGLIGGVIFIGILINFFKKTFGYSSGAGFGSKTETKKKITRTLIKYYPTCPGCGAARPEGKDKCEYCGRSFIESEEVVEEKEIKEPSKYSDEGTFRYGDSPNTYVRVHVTHISVPRSSCAHSSCAHSSCACAHSCACACACACAGGGRAGCSVKDFYNTGLKLKQLERKKNRK